MRVAVVGLGGVGGYLSAKFAKAGIDFVGFARGKYLEAIQQEGITIVEDTQTWQQKLLTCKLEEAEGFFDVVLFCVKSYDLEEAYRQMQPHLHDTSIVLSFSNGVDNGQRLRDMGALRVLDGCIYILAHQEDAGVIRKKGKVFAAVFGGEDTDATQSVVQLFEDAQLRYKTPQNIQEALWKKYIFISAFATLTSYYDTSIGSIYEEHLQEAKELLQEIAKVAKVYGVNVDAEIEKSLETASKVPYDSSTSMHKDFCANKQVELESLSGFVAKTQGVQTPLMKKMYETLKERV